MDAFEGLNKHSKAQVSSSSGKTFNKQKDRGINIMDYAGLIKGIANDKQYKGKIRAVVIIIMTVFFFTTIGVITSIKFLINLI